MSAGEIDYPTAAPTPNQPCSKTIYTGIKFSTTMTWMSQQHVSQMLRS